MCSTNDPKVRRLTGATTTAGSMAMVAERMFSLRDDGPAGSASSTSPRLLECADGESAAPVPLEQQESDDQGNDGYECADDDDVEQGGAAVADRRRHVPGAQAHREREQFVVAEHHQRQEEVVPGT